MYSVTVPKFEEQTDSTGYLVTYYVVLIEYPPHNLRYSLYKRYSSFGILYDVLKSQYRTIEDFRFPNKSMFNTHANFTKERRRQGFDDFLKIVAKLHPMPPEVEEFLEIQDHVSKLNRKTTSSNPNQNSVPTENAVQIQPSVDDGKSINDNKVKANLQQTSGKNDPPVAITTAANGSKSVNADDVDHHTKHRKLEPQYIKNMHKISSPTSHGDDDSKVNYEMIVTKQVQAVMPKVLRTTFSATLLLYFACIYFSIIDTSNTSVGRMFLTILSVGSAFSFLRISLIKREILKQQKIESSTTNGNTNLGPVASLELKSNDNPSEKTAVSTPWSSQKTERVITASSNKKQQ